AAHTSRFLRRWTGPNLGQVSGTGIWSCGTRRAVTVSLVVAPSLDPPTTLLQKRPNRKQNKLMPFQPYDRPVRAAFIGLGRIYDLNVRAYLDNPDVEVVALVDPDGDRRAQRQKDWPAARTFGSTAELAASG